MSVRKSSALVPGGTRTQTHLVVDPAPVAAGRVDADKAELAPVDPARQRCGHPRFLHNPILPISVLSRRNPD